MNKFLLFCLVLLFPFLLQSQTNRKVLIIGIDGCRSDALVAANTPNIDDLISQGIYSPDALNEDITISGPGWSAILCGIWSDKHLVTGNDFSVNDYDNFPPFFKYVNDFDDNLHTVSICQWGPINNFIIQDHADFKLNVETGLEVANQAAAYFNVNDPDVMFLHFDDVDHAGHAYEFSPSISEYLLAIESVDTHIGTVISAIEQRPTFVNEDWLILVTTDHGGIGTFHGGTSIEEENVFVIASGTNVMPELILKDSMIVMDTINNCLGDSIELVFDGTDDYVQVPANPLFNFGNDQDFTIECRIRTDVSGDFAIVGNKDWDSGVFKGFVFSFKFPSGPEWKVNIGDGTNRVDLNTGGEIADNEWHTLSVSFDRDGWMKMYQDGVLLDSADISFIGNIDTNEGLFFGTDIESEFDFTGSIAEVRVWNTLVEDQTIADWHCSAIDINHPDYMQLIGYWKLNEGFGNTEVLDHTVNNNNGIINGATWKSPDMTSVIYDYSMTSRLTDIVPTALTHLCIPIDQSWSLEGISMIPMCVLSSTENDFQFNSKMEVILYPNPTLDKLQISLENLSFQEEVKLEVFNLIGNKEYDQWLTTKEIELNLSQLNKGVHFLTISTEKERVTKRFIKI